MRAPLVARFRYELLALTIVFVAALLHIVVDGSPLVSERASLVVRGVQLLEGRATDFKFRFRGERPPHPDVVVAAVDERGAQKYGLWPWNRAVTAEALSKLVDLEPRAIGLDMEFADAAADDSAAFRALIAEVDAAGPAPSAAWQKIRAALVERSGSSPDALLAAALAKAGPSLVQGVIPYPEEVAAEMGADKVAEQKAVLAPQVIREFPGNTRGSTFEVNLEEQPGKTMFLAYTPVKALADAKIRLGHIDAALDPDGAIRRSLPLLKLKATGGLLPSLSIQAAAIYLGAQVVPRLEVKGGPFTGVALVSPDRTIEVPFSNGEPYAPIFYPGPGTAVHTISLRDVIEGTVDRATVKGKIVLVGVTLIGSSGDQRVTPFSQIEPGVYTHAAFVSNLLENQFLQRPNSLSAFEILAMLVLGLLLARLMPRFESFRVKALLIAGASLLYLAVDVAAFARGLQLATVVPLASILATSFGLVFLGYASESQEKRAQRKTFERYLGADVLEEALLRPEKLDRGEKRELTVLFSDIRGFTTLSEAMLPDKLARFINDYLSPMTRIVFEEKGTLDKYIGDALMAFWNAPLDQADHAMRACRAAMAMLQKLEELKPGWKREGLPEIDIGIGINTGQMIVGNMGSDVRVDYTVMGDAVNLASRLEGTNKEYETRVILGEATYAQVKDQVIARRLGKVRVKGKQQPVNIYELRGIGASDAKNAEALADFEVALTAYEGQVWHVARASLQKVLAVWPGDAPSRRYLEEIDRLEKNPPGPGWDGVYTATHK